MRRALIILATILMHYGCSSDQMVSSNNGDYYYNDEEDCACNPDLYNMEDGDFPQSGDVVIRISRNGKPVSLRIYNGSINDSIVVFDTITSSSRNVVHLAPNENYTYVANYSQADGSTVLVPVRADYKCELNECNGAKCYFFSNDVIDLSLRF